MKLTLEQQKIVGDNMGLVGKVIKDRVHGISQLGVYSYEDIFQIGCIGLCKAVATDKGGCFSTYAYRLIWNEICTALIYASKRISRELVSDPMQMPATDYGDGDNEYSDIDVILDRAMREATGVTAKGIQALRMTAVDGYTCREIGAMMGASPNNISAWISKARKFLKTKPELMAI